MITYAQMLPSAAEMTVTTERYNKEMLALQMAVDALNAIGKTDPMALVVCRAIATLSGYNPIQELDV